MIKSNLYLECFLLGPFRKNDVYHMLMLKQSLWFSHSFIYQCGKIRWASCFCSFLFVCKSGAFCYMQFA